MAWAIQGYIPDRNKNGPKLLVQRLLGSQVIFDMDLTVRCTAVFLKFNGISKTKYCK
jgi:hypothetical protein